LNKTAQKKALAAEALYQKGEMSVNGIAETLSISKATLYKYLRYQSVKIGITRRGYIMEKTSNDSSVYCVI
jgi:DeoR/GlpR family transcriptional regulator of sugar metabolism